MTPFRLGLTGSIGMGKSTAAAMFAAEGVPVWASDEAVHRLYAPGGAAVGPVAAMFPAASTAGGIDRDALKRVIAADAAALRAIEAVVHPLVAADRRRFVKACDGDLILLDVPLLFETGADAEMDATLVMTAPQAVQRARVLSRPGMTEALFDTVLARQMPDSEKRARGTHIIESLSLEAVRACVRALVIHIRSAGDARNRS